ncbi:MAG: hypothetical protein JW760_02365 [Spirochaetales bacterium]|nr:hypothetical protein [Spirochaetales bacterium]
MDQILGFRNLPALMKNDRKNIFRDPLFMLIFLAPFLILLVVYLGVPLLRDILLRYTSFDLVSFYPLILAFMVAIPALLYGFVSGFMLLDDRDEKILLQIMVTPFGLRRYVIYRVVLLACISLIFSFFFLLLNPLVEISWVRCAALGANVCMESLAASLFLLLFAKNKVEGLAKGKMLGIIFIGPLAAWFIPAPYHYAAALLPPYWNGLILFSHCPLGISVPLSLFFHGVLLFLFFRRLNRVFQAI